VCVRGGAVAPCRALLDTHTRAHTKPLTHIHAHIFLTHTLVHKDHTHRCARTLHTLTHLDTHAHKHYTQTLHTNIIHAHTLLPHAHAHALLAATHTHRRTHLPAKMLDYVGAKEDDDKRRRANHRRVVAHEDLVSWCVGKYMHISFCLSHSAYFILHISFCLVVCGCNACNAMTWLQRMQGNDNVAVPSQ